MRKAMLSAASLLMAAAAAVVVATPPGFFFSKTEGTACAAQHGCLTMPTLWQAVQCCATFCSATPEMEKECQNAVFGTGNDPTKDMVIVRVCSDACGVLSSGKLQPADTQRLADSYAIVATQYPSVRVRDMAQKMGNEIPLIAAAMKAVRPHNEGGDLSPTTTK